MTFKKPWTPLRHERFLRRIDQGRGMDEWNAADRHKAHSQGWLLNSDGMFVAINAKAIIHHGCTVSDFVQRCAGAGSKFHEKALVVATKRRLLCRS